MKLLSFEWKKLYRSAGIRTLCLIILALNLAFSLLGNLTTPDALTEQKYIDTYDENIAYVIRVAQRNLLDYRATLGDDSYLLQYQQDVIHRYSELQASGVAPVKVIGWNQYFDYTADDLLLLLMAAILGVLMGMVEWDHGTHAQLRMTPRGKKACFAKIYILTISSFLLTLFMMMIGLAGILLRFGLSSPNVPLCSVMRFAYCPYDLSITAYLCISFLVKAVNALVIALFSAWISSLLKSYLVGIFSSLTVLAVSYGISTALNSSSLIYLNPYAAGLTDPIFERYRAVNLLGNSVSFYLFAGIFLAALCVSLFVLFPFGFLRGAEGGIFTTIEKTLIASLLHLAKKCSSVFPHRKAKRHSLFFTETKKVFFKSHLIFLCVIMLLIKSAFAVSSAPISSAAEEYYRNLCYEMSGELTEQKRQTISEELSNCERVISDMDHMRAALQNGMITGAQYSDYLEKYDLASIKQYAYQQLSKQCNRIDAARSRGQEAYIIYDSGWRTLFERDADILLFIFLLLFFGGIYDHEYKFGFDRIACTTKRGMRALHQSKLTLSLMVSCIAFTLFFLIDLFFLSSAFPLTHGSAPVSCVTESWIALPLWSALLIQYLVGTLLASLFSALICLLSRFLKRIYLVIPIGGIVVAMLLKAV